MSKIFYGKKLDRFFANYMMFNKFISKEVDSVIQELSEQRRNIVIALYERE